MVDLFGRTLVHKSTPKQDHVAFMPSHMTTDDQNRWCIWHYIHVVSSLNDLEKQANLTMRALFATFRRWGCKRVTAEGHQTTANLSTLIIIYSLYCTQLLRICSAFSLSPIVTFLRSHTAQRVASSPALGGNTDIQCFQDYWHIYCLSSDTRHIIGESFCLFQGVS